MPFGIADLDPGKNHSLKSIKKLSDLVSQKFIQDNKNRRPRQRPRIDDFDVCPSELPTWTQVKPWSKKYQKAVKFILLKIYTE